MIVPFFIDRYGKLQGENSPAATKKAALKRAERRARVVREAMLIMKYGKEGVDYYF